MSQPAITPELIAKAEKPLQDTYENVLKIADDNEWKQSKVEDDVTYFTRSVRGSSFTMIKSTTIVPYPVDKIVEFLNPLKELNPEMSAEERDGAIERSVYPLEGENPHGNAFVYLALESGSRFVSPRDFVMARKYFEKDGKHYFIIVSIDDDTIRPITKKFVRGKILCNATIIEKDPADENKTKLSFVAHADPCGSIPAMIYNTVALKQGACVKKIREEAIAQFK